MVIFIPLQPFGLYSYRFAVSQMKYQWVKIRAPNTFASDNPTFKELRYVHHEFPVQAALFR